MKWIESPLYFCTASETAKDVAKPYIKALVGSRDQHKFVQHAVQEKDFDALPTVNTDDGKLQYMVKVYVDNFTSLAVPTSREQLVHVTNLTIGEIHDVFPVDEDDENDPLSLKKILKLESMWALHKDILGFTFDGLEKTIWLEAPKRDSLLVIMKG